MTELRKVAIFDVDGTIFRSSLLIELVEQLIRDGIFPEDAQSIYATQKEKWEHREGEYNDYIMAVVAAFKQYLQGVQYQDLSKVAKKTVAAHWKRTYTYTRTLIGELKEQGYFVLAVSHSPKLVLDEFCPRLGFDKVYGVLYEVGPTDAFTGAILYENEIFDKASIVKRAVEKYGLTLQDSVGVGDTEGDIPFLSIVEKPICFNPNQNLYRHAKRFYKWKVVVERKDVVYEL